MRHYLIKTHYKERAGGMVQGIGPEFKPNYCKRKKKRKNKRLLINDLASDSQI
jgi:hypothetical protein